MFKNGFTAAGPNLTAGGTGLKVRLYSAYTPNVDTHGFLSDVTGAGTELTTALGYTAGGIALTTVTFSRSSHTFVLDCDNPTWSSSPTFTAAYAVFYDSVGGGTDATRPLIAYWDFGGSVTANGVSFVLQVATVSGATGGLANLTGSG